MKKYIPQLFVVIVVSYLLFLIRPAILGQLGGTFKTHLVPQEYVTLEKLLVKDGSFGRILWVPAVQRYGYYSPTHPAVGGYDLYHTASISGVLGNLAKQQTEKDLQERSIKYVVVPYDVDGEIFLKDRKYDPILFKKTVDAIQHVSWMHEIPRFGRIHVFVLGNPKDHLWVANNAEAKVSYQLVNPTEYKITAKGVKKGDLLVFTDSYDKNWQLTVGNEQVSSIPYNHLLNSFVLPKDGSYSGIIYFTPQRWVDIGLIISLITLVGTVVGLVILSLQLPLSKNSVK